MLLLMTYIIVDMSQYKHLSHCQTQSFRQFVQFVIYFKKRCLSAVVSESYCTVYFQAFIYLKKATI